MRKNFDFYHPFKNFRVDRTIEKRLINVSTGKMVGDDWYHIGESLISFYMIMRIIPLINSRVIPFFKWGYKKISIGQFYRVERGTNVFIRLCTMNDLYTSVPIEGEIRRIQKGSDLYTAMVTLYLRQTNPRNRITTFINAANTNLFKGHLLKRAVNLSLIKSLWEKEKELHQKMTPLIVSILIFILLYDRICSFMAGIKSLLQNSSTGSPT